MRAPSMRFRPASVLLFLSLYFSLFLSLAPAAVAAQADIDARIASEELRRKELDRKLEGYRKTIQQMKTKENDTIRRIDEYRQDAEKTHQEIAIRELQIGKIQKNISILNDEMGKNLSQSEDIRRNLRRRLIDISKYGASEELLLILSAENTHEMLDSVYLLERLARHDQYLMEQLQNKQREIELSQRTLKDHQDRLTRESEALGRDRQKYNATIKETNSFLDGLRRQKAAAERAAKEMEEAQKVVGETILALMRQRKARDEAAKRAGKGSGSVDYLAGRAAQGRGSMFDWPLRGPVSSHFGMRIHPVFRTKTFHSGLDVSAPRGTPVKTAAPGEVLFVGWMKGYGQVVIIDHGRDYSTVYAHMSSTQVREGAVVKAGTVIGLVGNTGTTTGYNLHFEVRVGSAAKNPLDYLKR